MEYLEEVRRNLPHLLRGVTLIVGGFALIVAGTFVGTFPPKVAQVAAGLIATGGVVSAFLGFFLYIIPPLLPAK